VLPACYHCATKLRNGLKFFEMLSLFRINVWRGSAARWAAHAQMIEQGTTGPAAAALLALPAVNLGSLLIVGKVSRNWKVPLGLGAGVMATSIFMGIAFL
jgi:uncharacterized membrane protein YraQ (UPF0718 family)